MRLLEHDTRTSSAGDGTAGWLDAIETAFGPFALCDRDPDRFAGRLRQERRNDFRFIELEYAGHGFQRRRRDVSRLDDPYCSLIRPTRGRLMHNQNGEARTLEPGRFYVINHAIPYQTRPELAYGVEAIAFSPAALESRAPQCHGFHALDGEIGRAHV